MSDLEPVELNDGTEVVLELFKFDSCPFCQKVMHFIEDKDIEGVHFRDTKKEPGAQDELVERGGKGQVPCLFIDDEPLYESDDIIEWLEENLSLEDGLDEDEGDDFDSYDEEWDDFSDDPW